jgi:hypothetical protein
MATKEEEIYVFFNHRRRFLPTFLFLAESGAIVTSLSGQTFTKAADPKATYMDAVTGVMVIGQAENTPRIESDGILLEPAGANICLDSRNIDDASAAWEKTNTGSEAQNATGVDGVANKATTITDSDAGATYIVYSSVSKSTTDTSPFCNSIFVDKTTGATTFPGFGLRFFGVLVNTAYYTVNTNTGVITARDSNNAANINAGVIDAGLWWRVWVTATDNGANNVAEVRIFPAVNTDASATWDTATQGSAIFDCAQMEYNKTYPSSYIDGDGAALGSELIADVNDRTFAAESNWANVDLGGGYNEAGDLTITANGVGQYCTLPVANAPTTANTTVCRLGVTVANYVGGWDIKSFDGTQTIGSITGNDTYYFYFIPSTTGGFRIVATNAASSGDFDNFSLKTCGVTRLSEAGLSYDALSSIFDGSDVGTVIVWAKMGYPETANATNEILSTTTAQSLIWHDGTNMSSSDGTNIAVDANPAWVHDGYVKFVVKFPSSTGKFQIGHDFDGAGVSWGAEQTFDGAYTSSTLVFGRAIAAGFHIKRVEVFNEVLADGQINGRKAYNE